MEATKSSMIKYNITEGKEFSIDNLSAKMKVEKK
jgi:hypothetical protein